VTDGSQSQVSSGDTQSPELGSIPGLGLYFFCPMENGEMKTLDQAMEFMKSWEPALDGRDHGRFCAYITMAQSEAMGWEPVEGMTEEQWGEPKEWSPANILEDLKKDVFFGLEKAQNQRGISSGMMFRCVNMWCHLLENDLQEESYDNYALDFFLKVMQNYGWYEPDENAEDIDAVEEPDDPIPASGEDQHIVVEPLAIEKQKEVLELARPLIHWLRENASEYTRLVISHGAAEIVETSAGITPPFDNIDHEDL